MKKTHAIAASLLMTISLSCDKLNYDYEFTTSDAISLGIGNLTMVMVKPNLDPVHIHRVGYNQKNGNAFQVPYEMLTIKTRNESYSITDKTVSNNQLSINGKTYNFNAQCEYILIENGKAPSIAKWTTAKKSIGSNLPLTPFDDSIKIYDHK